MKLVNPVGRDLTELETEAYSCHCVCSSGLTCARMSGYYGDYAASCACECDFWYHDHNSAAAKYMVS
ncbi:CA_C0660 family putative sactipeptide bacteriocin [Clostridium felsineum]|uniref:CA_C0660 family putative sactipeptide bacteriocin n=1 Tax=Clostridium felsineum TaxID=36839 RepID=UPI00098CD5F9|nr:CA_C0660 family putative sactipeptide bacteriocin [Clostridium felsineum]URZ17662.1 hypothetical protein CLFE_037160 [Clostridium felsineum DSM 794]